jgi:GH15 family glucan-1,4-alpha-glucosidase
VEVRFPDISDYGFLSDCHSSALVTRDVSVEWCCFGRFDADPVFCRILDREKGGHFRVGPIRWRRVGRRYVPGTNVIETTYETGTGLVAVTDCLVVDVSLDPASAPSPSRHQLIRRVRGVAGSVEVALESAPRFTFGLVSPMLIRVEPGVVAAVGGADSLVLQSDLAPLRIEDGRRCEARGWVPAGDVRFCSVTHAPSLSYRPVRYETEELRKAFDLTVEAWRAWSSRLVYEGDYREIVERSALVLTGIGKVRARIDTEGVDPKTGAFVQALGSTSLDATALTLPMLGFVPFDDPRVTATINAIQARLSRNGHVYRYLDRRDGLQGGEGTFAVSTTWMVVNLALTGRTDEAVELLDRLLECANDLGLLSEEIDAASGALLGNYPQAFSHIGMIWAAWAIDAAR